jgi:ATP-dependent DNA helicase RecQ
MPELATWSLKDLQATIAQYWGYGKLRPMQEAAMRASLEGRDSLVVLPTGGGKSLCFQAPAVYRGSTTVVVSPLIALMKDQVDNLRNLGVPAVYFDHTMSIDERSESFRALRRGQVRLAFVSPERLALSGFQEFLQSLGVDTFAIDEAHCISHWGHEFRPQYRQLRLLRELFPDASFHAYTATATERVRRDIIEQLGLHNPQVLVGDFDRPNLTYRVVRREKQFLPQVLDVLSRHEGEAGIIYCLSRKDVDDLTSELKKHGHRVQAYHAGMDASARRAAQDAFAAEECDIVVATVAFGMGIDRSNIRFVLHAKMPPSIEHYQQEAGRAGRDGLGAECVLLYTTGDFMTRKSMIEKTAAENGAEPAFIRESLKHLDDIHMYCRSTACRHKALVEYFGQKFASPSCGACDLCLDETKLDPDALVFAQKILSCVARVKEGFGAGHIVSVLRGETTDKITKYEHHQLSTFNLLADQPANQIRDWIHQLIEQSALSTEGTEYPILKLTPVGREIMRGVRPVRLLRSNKPTAKRRSVAETTDWDGVDRALFDVLRNLRRKLASEKQIPTYLVFGDEVLRDLARKKPTTLEAFATLRGVGATKLRELGPAFVASISAHVQGQATGV